MENEALLNVTHGISEVMVKRERAGRWYRAGNTYQVTRSPYGATESGTYACCPCPDCVSERTGKRLMPVYVVMSGPERGSIIYVEDCDARQLSGEAH